MSSFLTRLGNLALDLIFPRTCAVCAKITGDKLWCANCTKAVQTIPYIRCPGCNLRVPDGRTCQRCKPDVRLAGLITPFPYASNPIRQAILEFKFKGVTANAEPLATYITDYITSRTPPLPTFEPEHTLVVPVPLGKKRFRERGFNQSAYVAEEVAKQLQLPYSATILAKQKETKPQITMDSDDARRDNVASAFAVTNEDEIKGKTILLVDDVYTTGATLTECTKTLRLAGAKEVWGVTIAKS